MNKIVLAIWCLCLFAACQDEGGTEILVKPEVTTSEFTDIRDGDTVVYKCITVGGQTWMAENLRYKISYGAHFGSVTYGDEFKKVQSSDLVRAAKTVLGTRDPVYRQCSELAASGKNYPEIIEIMGDKLTPAILEIFYGTAVNEEYLKEHGYLYTFEGALKAVPAGWRIPTDEDWKILETNLGISREELEKVEEWRGTTQGKLLKEGEEGIGFDAKMSGARVYGTGLIGSTFMKVGTNAYFWSSTLIPQNDSINLAVIRSVKLLGDQVMRGTSKLSNAAYSVRCIKE